MNNKLNDMELFLSKLPSISKKNAKKISILLATNKDIQEEFLYQIKNIKDIHKCKYCNILTNEQYCQHCLENEVRKVIIINSFNDYINLEKIGIKNYQVFLIDNDGKIDIEKIDLSQFIKFVDRSKIEELIIFISPTVEGKILTNKIINICKEKQVKTSKIRVGVPFGASIESIDTITLKESLKKREEV